MNSPEWEDHETCDDEDGCEQGEDEVAGFPPACVVKHLGRLERGTEVIIKTFSLILH